jgi:hypothetical protein
MTAMPRTWHHFMQVGQAAIAILSMVKPALADLLARARKMQA